MIFAYRLPQDDWEAEDDEDKPAAPVTEAPVKKKKSLAERIAEKEVSQFWDIRSLFNMTIFTVCFFLFS